MAEVRFRAAITQQHQLLLYLALLSLGTRESHGMTLVLIRPRGRKDQQVVLLRDQEEGRPYLLSIYYVLGIRLGVYLLDSFIPRRNLARELFLSSCYI